MSLDYIVQRDSGKYHFRITVPKAKRAKFGKGEFWESLGTKDRKEAIVKAAALLDHYMKLFKADEISDSTSLTIPLIQQTSERLDIQYHTPEAIEAASVQDYVAMMSRGIEALEKIKNPDIAEVAAIGSAVEPPALNMLELFDRFVELSGDKFLGLDKRARDKKVNRYKAAATDFVAIMGEIDVVNMTSKEAFDFAAKLTHRVADEEIELETAQKKLQHVGMFIRKVFQSDYPSKPNPFENAKIESNGAVETGKRRPFSEAEIVALNTKLQSSDANDELKAILAISECTGASMKEICLLTDSDFHLDEPFPFITIGPNKHRKFVKTGKSRHRDLPLIGKALEAAKRYAKTGFPRYARPGGSEALSAAANKLIEPVASGATTYCFRHRMADLLRNSGCVDTMKNSLMGHHSPGMNMRYGDGYDMPNKHKALKKALALAEKKQKQLKNQTPN
ncbi:tyrosine-type recombinase/integrase [Sinorhizobium medicae]|nr:tyrosine-type recombinase/integrase [Sinorhizobium medicae]MDX0839172.1 tyrosine-type recombinase/integrase [Sinorhizobium medicae]MDX1107932.1 tyrosine-type recombinase/integrase [Sinorhizobium medicae]MDX1120698.1 tyrosine-type recombinase/integrase [Sinorhizobium medicae]